VTHLSQLSVTTHEWLVVEACTTQSRLFYAAELLEIYVTQMAKVQSDDS